MKTVFTRKSNTLIQFKISLILFGLTFTISNPTRALAEEKPEKKHPGYSKVFNQKKLNRIDIIINKDTWNTMVDRVKMTTPPPPHNRHRPNPQRESDSNHISVEIPEREYKTGQRPSQPLQETPPAAKHSTKPEGRAATFALGTFNQDEMNLKSKKNKSTYEDVEKLYNILHSEIRTSNPTLWRTQLEEIFDVFTFLKWLAAKNVIENWDSYGQSPRNYYLYNNQENKLLTWIPWNNNEALFSPHQNHNNPHMHGNDSWPLIDFILADNFYTNVYNDNLSDFVTYIFNIEKMQDLYSSYSNLLKPYIIEESKQSTFIRNEEDFESAVEYLKKHVIKRNQVIEELLN